MKYLFILFVMFTYSAKGQCPYYSRPIERANTYPSPAYFVDGVYVSNLDSVWGHISPSHIESIDVLSTSKAVEKFGELGRQGAILITTKRKKK